MIIKSNSVPNFLYENYKQKKTNFSLTNKPKIVSYSEFLKNNKNSTKKERQNAIKRFYDSLLNK